MTALIIIWSRNTGLLIDNWHFVMPVSQIWHFWISSGS